MEQDKKKLMCIINESSFALYDLVLYLDTHPCDEDALRCYNDYRQIRKAAVSEYVANYGPLNSFQVTCNNYFSWVKGPWPWEGGCK